MRIIEHKKHKIEIYNSAEDMPIKRYQRFNKMLMIDNEVGSSFQDFDARSLKAIEYLKKGLMNEAIQELENRRQMVYNAFMEYSPKGRALAILIHSIDGEVYKDFSADSLDRVLDKLDKIGFSHTQSEETVAEVKKKSKWNWRNIFQRSSKVSKQKNSTTS